MTERSLEDRDMEGPMAPQAARPTAGRELDALVAEKVMGRLRYGAVRYGKSCVVLVKREQDCWNFTRTQSDPGTWTRTTDPITEWDSIPRFSTDIASAWLVVEKMGENWAVFVSFFPGRAPGKRWQCEMDYDENTDVLVDAESAPLAICLAALKACGELRATQERAE